MSYYAPAPNRRGIKRCFCLTSVCLSRTLGLSREQRGLGRPKLAQWHNWHVTHDSDTTFNVKRSKVNRLLGGARLFGPTGEEMGGCIPWRPPAYILF